MDPPVTSPPCTGDHSEPPSPQFLLSSASVAPRGGWGGCVPANAVGKTRGKTSNPRGGGVPSAPLVRRDQRRRAPRYGEAPSAPLDGRSQGQRHRRDGGLVVTAFGSRRRRHDWASMGGDQNARGTSGMARHGAGTQLRTAGTPGGSATTVETGKESSPIEREGFCHGSSELVFPITMVRGGKAEKPIFS